LNKAIFLDKDGTLVEDPNYMIDESQLQIIDGAIKGIKQLRNMGYKIIVVTNQSVVGRGMITEDKLNKILDTMVEMFKDKGAIIDKVYYCPHHPVKECNCRKPNSLLFEQAKMDFNINFSKSYVIGDLHYDINAGKKIGTKTILVLTGHGKESRNQYCNPDYIAKDLLDAFNIIKFL